MLRLVLLAMLATFFATAKAINPTDAAAQLAARLMGSDKARHIAFRHLPSEHDEWELRSDSGKIIILGNSAGSMAAGLGHYLKYYCRANVSWDIDEKINLPSALPRVPKPVSGKAQVSHRFFLNYCTFGYSMVWWQWREWERLIDWMAINGINMPLAITGQESVWHKVWTQLGLDDEQIRSYFTGPAHLPWHRMINLDRWQGPLPAEWLQHQQALQQQILQRERELAMRPVLPAFAGHVPEALKQLYPNAKITQTSSWGGFRDEYRSFFLDPMDSLFAEIQRLYLHEQTRLYGTDHIYGIDPFNEVDPPSWEADFLAQAGRQIYSTLASSDPDAVWVQMTWLFYIDQSHWTQPRIEAYLGAVPKGRLLLLDYFAENTEVWRRTESFFGHDFVWCYLGNFGGNTMLAGNLAESGRRIDTALQDTACSIRGIGSTLEAFDCNPLMYEYVLERAWQVAGRNNDWLKAWADRRLGRADERNRQAWQLLIDSVYTRPAALGQAPLVNARPSLEGHGNWTTNPAFHYSNAVLYEAWRLMLAATKAAKQTTYAQGFDLINIGRQYLSNHFMSLRSDFAAAYRRGDITSATRIGTEMELLLGQIDTLLTLHPYFSLQRWVDQASAFGTNAADSAYYRRNAKTLLTTWGESPQSLNDYASRTWAGLTQHYYHARWHELICEVVTDMQMNTKFDQNLFNRNMWQLERDFIARDKTLYITTRRPQKPLEFISRLQSKYPPR